MRGEGRSRLARARRVFILGLLASLALASIALGSAAGPSRELKRCPLISAERLGRFVSARLEPALVETTSSRAGETFIACFFEREGIYPYQPTSGPFKGRRAEPEFFAWCGPPKWREKLWKAQVASIRLSLIGASPPTKGQKVGHARRVPVGLEGWGITLDKPPVSGHARVMFRTRKAVIWVAQPSYDGTDPPMPLTPLIQLARMVSGFRCTLRG